ncbi:MAG: anti-sigma factor family protein, partial [Polyangiales bacterium]
MSCRLLRRHIGVFVDGELDPATQIEFERHLSSCAGCQELLAFEQSFRDQSREALGSVQAPSGLRERMVAALDAAPEPGRKPRPAAAGGSERSRGIRFLPMKARYSVPLGIAAALALVFAGTLPIGSGEGVQASAGANLLEDVVRLHSSELPADVEGQEPNQVARYFQSKVEFPVRPAEFDRRDVKLLGGRVSNVRDRRAAALYYDVHGRRVTVVVFDEPSGVLDDGAIRVRLGGRELLY